MSCDVAYGPCQQEPTEIARGTLTATSNIVNIAIDPQTSEYCYVVNASNGTFTVLIEGEIMTRTGEFMHAIDYLGCNGEERLSEVLNSTIYYKNYGSYVHTEYNNVA